MNKLLLLAVVLVTVAATASGCGRQCKNARDWVLEPTLSVMNYLRKNPSGEKLALQGCPRMIEDFENVPRGAEDIRKLAEKRFTDTTRTCIWWERGYRTRCERVFHPGRGRDRGYGRWRTRCYNEYHTYCARWRYDRNEHRGYRTAMELADHLETMHDRTHALCGEASAGFYDEAYSQSRDLLAFMSREVKPDGDRVYAMACGR